MARFVAGQPVVTAVPSVVVDAGLPVGQHRFRLEVLTDTGQRSPPDEAVVQVQALTVGGVPLSPTVSPTPTPALSRTIVSHVEAPSAVSTLPKTVLPSTKSRAAVPSRPRKKAASPTTASRAVVPSRPRKKTVSPSTASRKAAPSRPRKKTVSPSSTRRTTTRRRPRKKKE